MKRSFRAEKKDAGTRLDVFLTARLEGWTRSQAQKIIKADAASVNGTTANPHFKLSEGDEVIVDAEDRGAPKKGIAPRPDIQLAIVHEDDDLAVIDKPSGLLVHPATDRDDATLVHALVARWPQIRKAGVGGSPDRPGIMHRLDKDASGLMVVAKTNKAYESLKRQFQKHTVKKEYAVLVEGAPPADEGTVTLHIGRRKNSGMMAARPEPREGDKEAITHYRVDERFPKAALLTVRTETGRTHQIRAHMNAIGCPVVGDPLYGVKRPARLPSPRLFLHAKMLGFTHPVTRRRMEFSSRLPEELEGVLKKLRK